MEDYEKLKMTETRSRSLVKALAYRIISIIGTGLLIWAITRDIREAASMTITIQVFLIVLYYTYERVWNRMGWGRMMRVIEDGREQTTD